MKYTHQTYFKKFRGNRTSSKMPGPHMMIKKSQSAGSLWLDFNSFFHSWMSFGIPRATRCPDGSNIPVYSALGLVWENESIFADLALSLWRWSLHIFYLPADVFEEREVIRGLPGLSNWHPGLLSQARGSPHLPAGKSLSHSWLLWLQWSRHEPPAPGRTWDSGLVSLERSLS